MRSADTDFCLKSLLKDREELSDQMKSGSADVKIASDTEDLPVLIWDSAGFALREYRLI